MKTTDQLNALSREIINCAIAVHREMGPGLLESVYQHCLTREFFLRDIGYAALVPIPLVYKGQILNKDYVIDILVEDEVILELKAVEGVLPIHEAQLISYMKLAEKRLGFLINFNVPVLTQGLKRFVNKL
jgi:GxxExxY protein